MFGQDHNFSTIKTSQLIPISSTTQKHLSAKWISTKLYKEKMAVRGIEREGVAPLKLEASYASNHLLVGYPSLVVTEKDTKEPIVSLSVIGSRISHSASRLEGIYGIVANSRSWSIWRSLRDILKLIATPGRPARMTPHPNCGDQPLSKHKKFVNIYRNILITGISPLQSLSVCKKFIKISVDSFPLSITPYVLSMVCKKYTKMFNKIYYSNISEKIWNFFSSPREFSYGC
jgi:hypothetical protein